MASAKLAALAALVLLLQASTMASGLSNVPAVMAVTGFERGGDGGGPAACDGQYHDDRQMLAALTTGWYSDGDRCLRMISITAAQTGHTVAARVVDHCDVRNDCGANVIATSSAVWAALGVDTKVGEVQITWSDA